MVVRVKTNVSEKVRYDSGISDRGYEGKSQGYSTGIGKHTAAGSDEPPHDPAGRTDQRDRTHQAQDGGDDGGDS